MDTYVSTKEHHHTISMVNLKGWRRNEVRVQIYLLKVGKCIQNESKPDKSHHVKLVIVHSVERKTPRLDESVVQQKKPKSSPKTQIQNRLHHSPTRYPSSKWSEAAKYSQISREQADEKRRFYIDTQWTTSQQTRNRARFKKGHATVTLYFSACQNLKNHRCSFFFPLFFFFGRVS